MQMEQFRKLRFYSDLQDIEGGFDIVHIGSTLQYIDDWQGLLEGLITNYKPKYFVFSDLLAGAIPTFVTHQLFYGKRIPHHFFNWDKFIFLLKDLGFSLLYTSKFMRSILGQDNVFPNFGLSESHRIDRPLHAIFVST